MVTTGFMTRILALICVALLTMMPSGAPRAENARDVPELRVGVLEFGSSTGKWTPSSGCVWPESTVSG